MQSEIGVSRLEREEEEEKKVYNALPPSIPFCHHSLHSPVRCTEKARRIYTYIGLQNNIITTI